MKKIYALLAMGLGIASNAQEQPATLEYGSGSLSKETSAMFKFDDVPVSLYTGVPDVSIPLLSLPTRSKDISIDMTYRYHPSGSAWNISYGGTITRVIENSSFEFRGNDFGYSNNLQLVRDIYKFSFMGYSGSFTTLTRPDGSQTILANKGQYIRIEASGNPTTGGLNSFTAYDTKGYKYVFDVYDKNIVPKPGMPQITQETRTSFHLTAIYDNNGQKLVGITYTEKFYQAPGSDKKEYTNITDAIQSEGFGKAQFVYSSRFEGKRAEEIVLSDVQSNIVKRIDFSDPDKLVFRDPIQTKNEEYRFYYSDGIYGNYDDLHGIITIDKFGYPNYIPYILYEDSYQAEGGYLANAVNPNVITRGVLEKIGLPTGGSILYEYESNTYSFFGGESISKTLFSGGSYIEDPDFYYNYDDYEITFPYNHIVEEIASGWVGSLSKFTLDSPQTVYISVRPEKYFSDLSLTWVYPLVDLSGPGTNLPIYRPYNLENMGIGRPFALNSGLHHITMGPFGGTYSAYRTISTMRRNPDVKKWKYGGGRRIKRIAYFDTDAPANLFRQEANYFPQQYVPAKETRYSYNLFDEPNRSSGNLVADSYMNFSDKYGQVEFVGYRNVTVTESGNNGKTEYTFSSSADYPLGTIDIGDTASQSIDYKRGLLKNKKSYDRNGTVVQNTSYEYAFFGESNQISYLENRTVRDRVGRSRLSNETTTYYPANSEPIVKTTAYGYYDDINRSLESKTATTSAGEVLMSKYYYHTGNSPLSKNRISEIEKVEDYRNGNLVNTSKTDYSNTWPGNVSWLPSVVSASTGSAPLVAKAKLNRYDEFGNLLESEQPNGIKTSYVWGYNNTQMVAKIENMAYGSIPQSLMAAVQSYSDSATYNEASLLSALEDLRISATASGAMMTGYSYKPLVGVSATIDPKGERTYYQYDSFGRSKSVKDRDGNTLTENQYNYRP
ncbi:YD repeat-containing protein [Flavobacterium sp. 28YEA47A]|uniref:hypothetical protein n=1 Tax=Flavobacterium sp. 28YEA47A TaxID=3156276 RepID=UPI0035129C47